MLTLTTPQAQTAIGHKVNSLLSDSPFNSLETWMLPQIRHVHAEQFLIANAAAAGRDPAVPGHPRRVGAVGGRAAASPQRSHPLPAGDLSLHRIRAGDTSLAAIAALGAVQWPLARDVADVKLDPRHYSFSFAVPALPDDPAPDPLHYGLPLSVPDPRLDALLGAYTRFSTHSVAGSEGLADGVRGESRPPRTGPSSRPTSRSTAAPSPGPSRPALRTSPRGSSGAGS
ncbi:hypothetical protein D1007_00295 [Hordeum vulgare]|nr:hypothetical protein D1007_00295 [Hordeum vulgare]